MAQHNGFVRKRVWVNGLIQGRVLTYVSMYWVMYHLLLLHATFLYNIYHNRDTMLLGNDALPITVVYGQFLNEHLGFVCCAAFVLPVILFDALWFSHRVVGPLYRIRLALQQIAAGVEVSPVRLRRGDYLNELADVVNDVRESIRELRADVDRIRAAKFVVPGESDRDQKVWIDRRELARLRAAAQDASLSQPVDSLVDDVEFEPELPNEARPEFAADSLEAQLIEHTRDIEDLVGSQRIKESSHPPREG